MEQKYVLGILAIALVAVLGVSIVSAYGFGKGFMDNGLSDDDKEEMKAHIKDVHEAIQNGDYEAWAELMNEQIAKMQEQITEENFNAIVERFDEMDQARTLREELRQAVADGDETKAEELRTQLQDLAPGNGMKVGWGMPHEKMHEGMMPSA